MIIAKGSSREIKNLKEKFIILDGELVSIPTIIKSRIENKFDQYLTGDSFGIQQNKMECDIRNNEYSILVNSGDSYQFNETGFLAPVFEFDSNFEWLEMSYVNKINKFLFQELTITDKFPNGINFDSFVYSANKKYRELHGIIYPEDSYFPNQIPDSKYELLLTHPWVANFISWMELVNFEANDLITKNMGIFTHPITMRGYPVICDYGISREYWQKYCILRDAL